MAKVVEQSLAFCPNCQKKTMHYKETKKLSWLMHLVLIIITAGLWLAFLVITMIWHMFTKKIGGKRTCSQCGLDH